jgi:hypothetical protein
MTDLSPLHDLFNTALAEIREHDRKRAALVLKAESFRLSLQAMGETNVPPIDPPVRAERKNAHSAGPKRQSDSRAGTRLFPKWRDALAKLDERGGEFGYDNVLAIVSGPKTLARTKMSDFVQRGLVERKRDGYFVLTETGRQAVGRPMKVESPAPAAAQGPAPAPNPVEPPKADPPKVDPPTAEAPKVEPPKVEAPGVAAPGAPVAAPSVAQVAAPVSGMSNPSPVPGA